MTFLSPARLLLLLVVAALLAGYVWAQRRRPSYAVRLPGLDLLAELAPRTSTWRRHVPTGLLLLALTALTVGFARPQADREVPRERATVVVALDVSLSMMAEDVDPDRITEAKAAAKDFVAGLPARFNVGLVAFNGTASVVVPPTLDHGEVQRAVDDLQLGAGTAIGEAVVASLAALESVPGEPGLPPPPARVVLLSDGANTQGRPVSRAAALAEEAKVPVSTIAYGTQDGVVVVEGQNIPVPVDGPALAELAEQTGGQSYEAESGEQLSQVYEDIGSSVGTTVERQEVSDLLTGLGLLLGLGAVATSLLWSPRLP
ncbi:MAG: von Willebrand factor, type [Frankiales bacterium]|nr:von Willebrand factor, type [Frankiales bacterium]